jgi:hypothetical protein
VLPRIVLLYAKTLSSAHTKRLLRAAATALGAAFAYSPVLTLSALEAAGATAVTFAALLRTLPEYNRALDCKVTLLGLIELLRLPLAALQRVWGVPQLLGGVVFLQVGRGWIETSVSWARGG